MKLTVLSIAMLLTLSAYAEAEQDIAGEYACTVLQKAGIASIHLEGADLPKAYLEEGIRSTFGIKIDHVEGDSTAYLVKETADSGDNPDRMDYGTQFTVLHSAYYGNGFEFKAGEDQGFLRLHHRQDGGLYFYHAGFEYPGGVDVRLSARFGECLPQPN